MSLLRTLLLGRENGVRARIRQKLFARQDAPPAPGPASARGAAPPSRPVAAEKALNLGVEAPKDVTPPDGYEVVLHREALKPGEVIEVIIAGRAIAVANVGGSYFACTNTCPHAEGPLGEGTLEGHVLTCPYHGWQFDLRDGGCLTSPNDRIRTYKVQVVQDAVCVEV